ncbi:MAG TPA: serine/threonine protein phosphatase [Planctomycetaceae bacterium]|nr:serine/threonine protein phosphatase [Planctomycetaceae bacterium]
MPSRILAVGDIHGCTPALVTAMAAAEPRSDDTIVALGDYIDRGPDSRGTIEYLLDLGRRTTLIPLLGNHDWMALALTGNDRSLFADWLRFGGDATLASYDCASPEEFPAEHLDFLRGCRLYHETERHFFVHGNYIKELPLDQQPEEVLLWDSLRNRLPGPHVSGKMAVVGHTSQKSGEILDLDYARCIDTWVYGDGWLTVLDVVSGERWQADKEGNLRERRV